MNRVLKFGAPWCNACNVLDQTLEKIEGEIKVPLEKINIDENPQYGMEFGIKNLPTMVMLDGNTEVKRFVGIKTENELKEWLNA